MKSFPRFFTKQLLGFVALAFLIVIVDLFLCMAFAIHEVDTSYNEEMPSLMVKNVDEELVSAAGGYVLSDEGSAILEDNQAWAMLVAPDGSLSWSDSLPDDLPKEYGLNDIAVFSRMGYLDDYPVFIWTRNDGLLVLGFPKGSYYMLSTEAFPNGFLDNIPLYIMIVLLVDLTIFFIAYMLSKRRAVKSVAPITQALDELSTGQTVDIRLKGDLADVADRINETSAIIKKKDHARDGWIRGISHDIRTPLSIIMGYADGISADEGLPEATRKEAAVIRNQGIKIKNLVLDLNTANQLAYDMQPLHITQVPVARLLREMVAEYINGLLPEQYSLELEVSEGAQDLVATADERLLRRAIQNLIQNAIVHNPHGCAVTVSLLLVCQHNYESVSLAIADDGQGVSEAQLAQLQARLLQARMASREEEAELAHGLGLVLVEKIVREHGGSMRISSRLGNGFKAELFIPMEHKAAAI